MPPLSLESTHSILVLSAKRDFGSTCHNRSQSRVSKHESLRATGSGWLGSREGKVGLREANETLLVKHLVFLVDRSFMVAFLGIRISCEDFSTAATIFASTITSSSPRCFNVPVKLSLVALNNFRLQFERPNSRMGGQADAA